MYAQHSDSICECATVDAQIYVTVAYDFLVRIWDITRPEVRRKIAKPQRMANRLAASPVAPGKRHKGEDNDADDDVDSTDSDGEPKNKFAFQ